MNGFVRIDKGAGLRSREADGAVKRVFRAKRVGHLGTLDPFATGLLIVAADEATKALSLLDEEEKEYMATLRLGESTVTLDTETPVSLHAPVPELSEAEIIDVLSSFLGTSLQTPPLYSAKWVEGKRAYDFAREGEKVALKPISITISAIHLVSYDPKARDLLFSATVSKGTYLRVLGKDIAAKLGTIGYLRELRRTRVGSFTVEGAPTIETLTEKDCVPIEQFLSFIPQHECTLEESLRVQNGNDIALPGSSPYLFLMEKGILLAVYRKEQDFYRSYRGFYYGNQSH
jgi:tRNA pseudouridine55 synthase